MIECEDVAVSKMYGKVSFQYMKAMNPYGIQRRESLRRQGELIETLASLSKNIKQMRDSRPKKVGTWSLCVGNPLFNFFAQIVNDDTHHNR